MHPIENLLGNTTPFLERVFTSLGHDGIDVTECELDHICYRVETLERYEELKQEFSTYGSLLSEEQIGGRAISTFKFKEPIVFNNRRIQVIELPSPKKGSVYPEGYEHVEFVIDSDFNTFMNQHPHINFRTKAISKSTNPDISIKYDGFSVKFHHNTLEYVITHSSND